MDVSPPKVHQVPDAEAEPVENSNDINTNGGYTDPGFVIPNRLTEEGTEGRTCSGNDDGQEARGWNYTMQEVHSRGPRTG